MEKKIVFVRLITGEELITTHTNTAGETFTFEKTLQLYITPPKAKGEMPGLGFVPFFPYTDAAAKVEINRMSVQMMCHPHPQLITEYQKVTGSVITPDKRLIIPT